jgi:anti-sigma regulatory factor (Ser/Thr protein kinase)
MHLPVDPSSVERARAFVVDTLSGWKADRHLEVATLLTSELVTNVVLHAGCDEMSLRVRLDDARLRVEVLDESPQLPTRTGTGNVMARGRGLTLVDALSTRWGADSVSNGKCVWFEVGQ